MKTAATAAAATKRRAAYRKLDNVRRDAEVLVAKHYNGLPTSRRQCWDRLSDYGWQRAVAMLRAAGVINKRGRFRPATRQEALDALDAEYKQASSAIERLRNVSYLEGK